MSAIMAFVLFFLRYLIPTAGSGEDSTRIGPVKMITQRMLGAQEAIKEKGNRNFNHITAKKSLVLGQGAIPIDETRTLNGSPDLRLHEHEEEAVVDNEWTAQDL